MPRSQSNRYSTATATSANSQMSQARKSLKATTTLDRPEFKGDKNHPSYAIDAEAEGINNAVDRTDNDLSVLDLGKKYVDNLGDVKLVIADLSGTMFEDLEKPLKPYPGVLDAFHLLKDSDITLVMMTNSWKASKQTIVDLLQAADFDVEVNDIFTSTDACKSHLKQQKLERPYYLMDEDVLQDFAAEYGSRREEDCVIVGLPSTQFDYRLLSKGMSLLLNGAPLITLNMVKQEDCADIRKANLGPGPFVSMLTFCTDAEPVTVCKPYQGFYEALCSKIGCPDYSQVVVIGDDINEDIYGAKALGMKAILTRTGRYQANDEKTLCAGFAPDATAENFAMAIRCVLAANAVSQMTEQDFVLEEKSSKGCGSELSAPKDEALTNKMQGYLNADYKTKRNDTCTPIVKLPSFIW